MHSNPAQTRLATGNGLSEKVASTTGEPGCIQGEAAKAHPNQQGNPSWGQPKDRSKDRQKAEQRNGDSGSKGGIHRSIRAAVEPESSL
jgi:hypothetical protein